MAFDGIFLHQIVNQMQSIVPAKINRIHPVSETELLFQLHANRSRVRLMVSAHSKYNRINLTNRDYPTPDFPGNFVMLLRKYLEGGIIVSMKQGGLDRYIDMEVSTYDELGDRVLRHVYIELMGKYANVILVDHNNKIVDALKRIPPFENTKRTIQPGAMFKITDPQVGKKNPFVTSEVDTTLSLTNQFEGFSPLLSAEIEYRMHNGESFSSIMQEIQQSSSVYISEIGDEDFFHCIPLTHLQVPYQEYPILEGLDVLYYEKEEKDRIRQQTGDLFKFIRRELKRNTNKLGKLLDSMQEAQNCDVWKERGDLLYAYMYQVKKGMTSIDLPSFETGEMMTIPLDAKLDGKQNAKKCFQKYTKGRNGKIYIQEQIDITNRELEYFRTIEFQLAHASFYDAKEIQEELIQNGYLKANAKNNRKKKKDVAPAFVKMVSPDGNEVCFGKNNLQNEYVTFKKANKNDYWFHVKDMHGSHVVLSSRQPSEADIRFCAMLAAYHSDGKLSGSIPIDYTPIKNLKKIPGGKTGMVTMSTYQTIYIDITDEFLAEYQRQNHK